MDDISNETIRGPAQSCETVPLTFLIVMITVIVIDIFWPGVQSYFATELNPFLSGSFFNWKLMQILPGTTGQKAALWHFLINFVCKYGNTLYILYNY